MFGVGKKVKIKKGFMGTAKAIQSKTKINLGISKPMTVKCYDGAALLVEENDRRWQPAYFESIGTKKQNKKEGVRYGGKTRK